MTRGLVLTAAFLLAGAVTLDAQAHSPSHGTPRPHAPGHVRPDSANHEALHALLHGSWKGSFTSALGVSSGMELAVSLDSARKVMLTWSADHSTRSGVARHLAIDGAKLQWSQDLSGTICKAAAVLTTAGPSVPPTMEGTLACEGGGFTFTLYKKA